MNKKVICGLLAAVLLLAAALLAGCGGGEDGAGDLSGEISGAITVSCYDAMTYKSFLENAAQKFQELYPGTTVTVETAGSMPEIKTQESDNMRMSVVQSTDDPQARDDYVNKINTELMSGRGADVLALDVLPYYKYAENGQLVDLSDYMQNDGAFNRADYAGNILDGAKYKGGQYLFPLDYTFDYFAYDSTLDPSFPVKNKLTFTEVIEAEADKAQASGAKIFGFAAYSSQMGGQDLFSSMFTQDYDQYIDVANKKANLNDGAFAALLETVQAYADQGYIAPYGVTANRESGALNPGAFLQNQQERQYAKRVPSLGLLTQFTQGLGQRMQMRVAGSSGNSADDQIAGLVANERGEAQFSYSLGFGINSNSANKRTAWEFIKFLAGEEMQASGLAAPMALPINNEARATLAAMSITGEAMLRRAAATAPDDTSGAGLRYYPEPPANGAQSNMPPPAAADGDGARPDTPPPANPTDDGVRPGPDSAAALTPEQQTALADYSQTLAKFTAQLNKLAVRDPKIDDMLNQEVVNFFSGEKTAAEVAEALQNKVSLYLNE